MAVLKKAKSTKITKIFSAKDYESMANEYSDLSAQIKALEVKKKELAEKLKQGAEEVGTKDDNGSFYIDGSNYIIGKIAKKSMSINSQKAIPVLKSKKLYKDCVDVVTVESVNVDKLSMLVDLGKIKLSEVENFTDTKVTYAVSVTKKEELPEVELSTFKSVAKRKK